MHEGVHVKHVRTYMYVSVRPLVAAVAAQLQKATMYLMRSMYCIVAIALMMTEPMQAHVEGPRIVRVGATHSK